MSKTKRIRKSSNPTWGNREMQLMATVGCKMPDDDSQRAGTGVTGMFEDIGLRERAWLSFYTVYDIQHLSSF